MNQRSSAPARAIAVAALFCGFVLVIAIVVGSLGGGDDAGRSSNGRQQAGKAADGGNGGPDRAPKSYVVQNGDTLTSIAHRTGVSVARIQELNPGVDPQILVSGEKLKLR
ncbi:MAG TPA: LysM domain-containing protein [Solirubrobacterales bacterium]|nr:LysM domain-containing protein [Solirubrobacterales bacterium]